MTKNLWCICRDVFKSSVHKREWLISWLTKLVWNLLNIMQLRITLRSTSPIDILIHLYRCAYITHTCTPLLSAVSSWQYNLYEEVLEVHLLLHVSKYIMKTQQIAISTPAHLHSEGQRSCMRSPLVALQKKTHECCKYKYYT